VFYSGLEGWDFSSSPALYLIGYFEVATSGLASEFTNDYVRKHFAENFHVRHEAVYQRQRDRLILVKGRPGSRLFERAVRISSTGKDVKGRELKVLSREMQAIFGDFSGRISIQRSPPRWIDHQYVRKSAAYVRSLD
jgi:hypothetical protein